MSPICENVLIDGGLVEQAQEVAYNNVNFFFFSFHPHTSSWSVVVVDVPMGRTLPWLHPPRRGAGGGKWGLGGRAVEGGLGCSGLGGTLGRFAGRKLVAYG